MDSAAARGPTDGCARRRTESPYRRSHASSVGRPPARRVEGRRGGEAAFLAGHEADHRRAFRNFAQPPHRNLAAHIIDLALRQLREDRALERRRGQRIGDDALARQFLAQGFGEADHARLRGRIGGGVRVALLARDGRHVDDPAIAVGDEMRHHRAAAIEQAVQVDVDHAQPAVDRILIDRGGRARDPRRADEDIDLPQRRNGGLGGAGDGRGIRHVERLDMRRPDCRLGFGEAIGIDVWRCSPRPVMPRCIVSPAFRKILSGFCPSPTPGGVPVINRSPGCNRLAVADLVRRHEPRTDGAERVAALALVPLAAEFLLERALRHVVGEHITGDMIERIRLFDIAAGLADHDAQFDLPIGLLRILGDHHRIVRPRQARDRLGEEDRLGRRFQTRLLGVVGIVEADRDELADPGDGHAVARAPLDQRQAGGIECREARQRLGRHLGGRHIGDHARQITDAAVRIDQAGLFGTAGARHVGVQLDAETGLVERARADAAVLRHRFAQQLRREHRHHFGRAGVHHQEFGEGRIVPGDDEMIAVDARSVRDHHHAAAVGIIGDLDQFGHTAAPAHIGLDDVAAAHVDQHAKAPARRLMLAGGDEQPRRRLLAQLGIGPIVVGAERLLDPLQPAFVPGPVREPGGVIQVERHPAIVHQPEIVATLGPHIGEQRDVLLHPLQPFGRAVMERQFAADEAEFLGHVGPRAGRVELQFVAHRAAQHVIDRLTAQLAEQIP
ncbi:hypothetical protein WR25_23081 [Diploscapter pachys]|uniref:Uncharacterized protein n=1 Tax=Diploscapter pachys TaxID=2018661 RepID=A0A2A2JXZ4_9BILA|nr:hypothetical protein WR25_23081 [Diploscapter pachys]